MSKIVAKIFKDQTAVRLSLQCNVDFTLYPVASAKIKYRKPDETEGEWNASVLTNFESLGIIYIDFNNTDNFDQSGNWVLWSEVTFLSGGIGIGVPIEYFVKTEGAKY